MVTAIGERFRGPDARVARLLLGVAARRPGSPRARTVNGAPGLVFEDDSGVVGVMAFTVAEQLITEIDFVVNPDKLRRVGRRA